MFIVLSLLLNIFLIIMIYRIIKIHNIKINKFNLLIIIVLATITYTFYLISIKYRQFIYYWDYANYYNIQLKTEEFFSKSLIEGLRYTQRITMSGEYGNFLSYLPEIIFKFTNHTANSYLVSCVLIFIPYLITSFIILINKILNNIECKNKNLITFLSTISLLIMPLLNRAFLYGQPDIFGLVFIFLLITITIDYNFKKLELEKIIQMIILTILLIVTRRWYIYWIVAYYFIYIIKILIENKKDIKKILLNLTIVGIISLIILLLTMYPLIKNILINNYKNSYIFYNSGGFFKELYYQVQHLGLLTLFIIILGIYYSLKDKKQFKLTIMILINYLLMIYLFTTVQNMGLHHSLILVPTYLYFIIYIIIKTINSKKIIPIILVLLLNFSLSICNNNLYGFISDVQLKIPKQDNYKDIEIVAKYLQKNLDDNAYMITHNNNINPDIFRNIYMPDKKISNYLSYGSAIIGVHPFPTQLFDSKYIITTDPFEKVSIEYKYDEVVKELLKKGTFKVKKEFNLSNNMKLYIYERKEKITIDEINIYKEKLKEESSIYPHLYIDEINNYIENKIAK